MKKIMITILLPLGLGFSALAAGASGYNNVTVSASIDSDSVADCAAIGINSLPHSALTLEMPVTMNDISLVPVLVQGKGISLNQPIVMNNKMGLSGLCGFITGSASDTVTIKGKTYLAEPTSVQSDYNKNSKQCSTNIEGAMILKDPQQPDQTGCTIYLNSK